MRLHRRTGVRFTLIAGLLCAPLAAAGGSPAALFGQWLLRHKTIKPAFQRVFWAIVGAQAALCVAYAYYRG